MGLSMDFDKKYKISYGIEESFENKIKRLESLPITTFADDFKLNDKNKTFYHLYHGLRFNGIEKLESIIKCGYILCGKDVNDTFKSYDGTNKRIILHNDDFDNCNNGKYISVIPSNPYDFNSIEFLTFVKENIFLELSNDVEALSTLYLRYSDYIKLKESQIITKKLYSYSLYEYMVSKRIPLNKIISIGIDSDHYIGDVNDAIMKINAIKNYYGVNIPFIDIGTKRLLRNIRK